MEQANGHVESLYRLLRLLENEIRQFVDDNIFYLEFRNKAWAVTPQGQRLLSLSERWICIRDEIEFAKKAG
jgi:hypothetical protein